VRYNFASFYYSGSVDELAAELQLKPAPTVRTYGFSPRDDGFITEPKRRGRGVVSNVQLYLDLINSRRGRTGSAIRQQLLATENGGYEPKE